MSSDLEEQSGGRFQSVQPLRDLESNWAVDLAKNLEEYLLKICSGEIAGEDHAHFPVNFAEAALLLQGSIQVYSRKVEYLYSLVLHALEFISNKRQQDQSGGPSVQPEERVPCAVPEEENDDFWGYDNIPVEAKNSLDGALCKDAQLNHFVKPPANLVVLEGDCLDTSGDGSELESYLLSTSDIYRDFILLDPCDAVAVDNYFKDNRAGKGQNGTYRGGSLISKSRKSFQSPNNRSVGTGCKSSAGKNQDANLNSASSDHGFEFSGGNAMPDPPDWDIPKNNMHGSELDDRYSESWDLDDSDGEDDPWKPLNPHEPGSLRVKPFKKVKSIRRQGISSTKRVPITKDFPLARMHGTISLELAKAWEASHCASERQESESPPLYEKLRHSLIHGNHKSCDAFFNPKDNNEDNEYDDGGPDFDMPEGKCEYEEVPSQPEKHDEGDVCFHMNNIYGHDDPSSQASLEDLCRSHLDALLASIAENEKQTELAARVSTWKQRIEKDLEEEDSRPPFDIHEYGEGILEKLSLDAERSIMSFADVVMGHEKEDVARTFSALLQLVNNGNVNLERGHTGSEPVCYTAVNPFYVRLLSHDKRPGGGHFQASKKRAKSPMRKDKSGKENKPAVSLSHPGSASTSMASQLNCKFSVKLGKVGNVRCTPEGKRRRRSRLVEPVD
ncbi:condensin-2 complex subunit H2 [Diospyros lotus]|uniref:condensin-2 complex subunit H2 n=1 Tax=Diospyros lotus TaxID=55363 RepID=UPI00225426A8|nr:condensin-2 complex subunit H2 [Diospyros lotus]